MDLIKSRLEKTSTRFRVTQSMYEELVENPELGLELKIIPKMGKHPKGVYLLPNRVARSFIESKQGTYNWDNHQDFKQDGIPSALRDYFEKER